MCGVILVSGAGRRLSDVIREQLRANPANAPVLDLGDGGARLARTRQARRRDRHASGAPALFAPQVQDFLIDVFRYDPAKLAAALKLPMLIVQGERDIQVSTADARALARCPAESEAGPHPAMNHVLKDVDERRPRGELRDLCRSLAAGRPQPRRRHRKLREALADREVALLVDELPLVEVGEHDPPGLLGEIGGA